MNGEVRQVVFPSGEAVPALGQGTWHMAEDSHSRAREVAALRLGLDLGLTLIDTAEMYAGGGAEELVGEAIRGRRDEVFLVSKVLPSHAHRRGTISACERSLKRLGTDRLDLYLLHWPGSVALQETVDAFEVLRDRGLIRHWGVSNFDVSDMEDVVGSSAGEKVATNQVLYNLNRRGIEYDLLPWCSKRRVPIMAYSPIDEGRLIEHSVLESLAAEHAATAAQLALAWVLRQSNVIAIPKSGDPDHVVDNRAALDLHLTEDDLARLDAAFPPPRQRIPLEML